MLLLVKILISYDVPFGRILTDDVVVEGED